MLSQSKLSVFSYDFFILVIRTLIYNQKLEIITQKKTMNYVEKQS